MKTLFDVDRLTLQDSVRLTIDSLNEYGSRYDHWASAYSGGKDSSAATSLLIHLIETGQIPRPKSLTVLYADTRMELTPLQHAATSMLTEIRRRGFNAETVLPALDDRFFVYMFGRGVPPPKNRFRWCTSQIKVEPMLAALVSLRDACGGKLLMLTGVRLGESAVRDARISLSCSRDGGECGQGWFQTATPTAVADTLAPLLHWRTCLVWDWLWQDAHKLGFPTRLVAEAYDQDVEGSAVEMSARTGCIGCPLASQEVALDRICRRPEWAYLAPLKRLKPLYRELTEHRNRLRKSNDERKADGSQVKNPGRIGPLTMDARRHGMATVLAVQTEVNEEAARLGRPLIDILNAEEVARIEELIAANTWPNRWTGSEILGNVQIPKLYADGTVQSAMFDEW